MAFELTRDIEAHALVHDASLEFIHGDHAGDTGNGACAKSAAQRDGDVVARPDPGGRLLAQAHVGLADGCQHHFFADIFGWGLFVIAEGDRD